MDYEVEETGMLVRNCKVVKLARNKQHLLAKDCKVSAMD